MRSLLTLVLAAHVAYARPLVIRDVTLIDGTGGAPNPHANIVIEGERFRSLGSDVPADAEVVDGAGKTAIPGLWDMHVHLTQMAEVACPALVANGVTGVRDMGGSLPLIDWMRERIRDRTIVGPQIFRAGPFVDGSKPGVPDRLVVANAEDGRKAVAYLQQRGVDFIKVHNACPPEAFFALLGEAQKRGVRTAGHVPLEVDPAAAIEAGYNSIEHMVSLFEGPMQKMVREGKSQREAMASFTDEKAHELGRLMREKNAWFDPTLIYYETLARQFEFKAHPDARERYVSKSAHEFWKIFPERPDTPETRKALEDAWARFLQIASIIREERVRFLVGTDLGGKNIFPGFSVHDELALLVKIGFTPMEALIAATRHAAECLGQEKDFGTIEAGKIADVVLLNGNPLDDIANTKAIAAVVRRGELFRKTQLDEMLERVAAEAPNR